MLQLLKIEWLKVQKYKTFWIMIGMFAIFLPIWNYGINAGILQIFGKGGIDIMSKAYGFGQVWSNLGFWASLFVVFVSILVIILVSNEFTFRTNRQNIIDGQTRLQFYHAKWMMVILLTIFTTLFVFITGVCFALANDSISNFPGNINNLFYVFVLCFNYYGFSMMIAILLKKSGLAIGMFFLYSMFIESLLKSLLNWKWDTVGNYLPLQSSDELLPFPIMDMAKQMLQMETKIPYTNYVLASFAWIIIYYFIARVRLVKTDW